MLKYPDKYYILVQRGQKIKAINGTLDEVALAYEEQKKTILRKSLPLIDFATEEEIERIGLETIKKWRLNHASKNKKNAKSLREKK